jgi:CspA family cold shock protein
MLTNGIVKWFDPTKKYGFITGADGVEVFFHISGVPSKTAPLEGTAVQYEVVDSPKGQRAANVVAVHA